MRSILSAALVVCATLAPTAACASDGDAGAAQKQSTKQQAKQSARQPPAKQAQRPKVAEVDEDGLKSLLRPGEARARPLLVNFWATWCAPCREEFPDLVKLRGRYPAEQLDLILVSLDDPSDIETGVPDFLVESGAWALPAYLLHAEDDGAAINLVDPLWGGELPATFLYDRDGKMVFNHKGRISPADVQAAVDKTLAASKR
jgi:thiol-disulfide isomerase/thioredoxin